MPNRESSIAREIRTVHRAFRKLASTVARLAPLLAEGAMSMATSQDDTRRPRRKPRLSAQQRAALKLQGKYMGTMRRLPAVKRAAVKKIRAAKGIRAAITAARKMAG